MAIRILPPEIANRIAAGEVVERPASVVKELLENSIDAGAQDVQIEIQEGGRRLIRVIDDGVGIPAEDTQNAFARHATSKLQCVEDLQRIATLGFRGEALASIAAVSRLSMTTRSRDEELGTILEMEAGKVVRREAVGRPAGTSITIEHLFHNVPARLKFLRTAATETSHINEVVTYYALAYPHLRLRLTSDGRTLFRSDGTGDVRDVLLRIFGLEMVRQLIPLETAEEEDLPTDLRAGGYIGVPSLHRSDRRQMVFFVNGRWIKDRSLAYAVVQAYHTMLPVGRFPVAFITVNMDAAEVDINMHPTKAEVRFREPGRVFGLVQRRVRSTLVSAAPIPSVRPWEGARPGGDASGSETWNVERWQKLVHAGNRPREEMADTLEMVPIAHRGGDESGVRLPMLRVIGQVRQTYIIAEGPEGLYLIDQHAAHERVLYEQMSGRDQEREVASQQLLEPVVVSPDLRHCAVLAENLAALQGIGYAIEPFGEGAFLVRAVPAAFSEGCSPAETLLGVLDELAHGEKPLARERDAAVMAAVCKMAAVKAGQTLSQAEMRELINQLEETRWPRTCPHGRPTMIHLSSEQLEKQFFRT